MSFEINVLALAAFLISACVGAYQAYWFFRGPDVSILPPEQVMFRPWYDAAGKPEDVHLFSRLTAINLAPPDNPETIVRASITVKVGDHSFTHHWQHFIITKPNQDPWLHIEGDAIPIVVGGRSAASKEIWFRPRVRRCDRNDPACNPKADWVQWEQFLQWIEETEDIVVIINATLASGSILSRECRVDVDSLFLQVIKENDWHAPPCHEPKD